MMSSVKVQIADQNCEQVVQKDFDISQQAMTTWLTADITVCIGPSIEPHHTANIKTLQLKIWHSVRSKSQSYYLYE